jgi:flagellar protein FliS
MSFVSPKSAIQSYKSVGVETGVVGANPHKLILMLFEGARLTIAQAIQHIRRNEVAEKGMRISQAIEIISSGLKASLNLDVGGQLADRLAALYDYMAARLLYANIHSDIEALEEVNRLLGEIMVAWAEIADDPAVLSATQAPA